MISFYTGTPGSGKSYHLAERVYTLLRLRKINVIANFEINLENIMYTRIGWLKHRITELTRGMIHFKKYNTRKLRGYFEYWTNPEITPENLLKFEQVHHVRRKEGQTLVIIDEAGIMFNCRLFGSKDRQDWTDFFAKHRHHGFDFVLACQFDRQVDKQIRCCVEYETVHRKLANYKLFGKLLSLLLGGNVFLCKQNWYASRDKLSNGFDFLRYSKRIASLYDTFAEFTSDGSGCSAGGGLGAPHATAAPPLRTVTQSIDAAAAIRKLLQRKMCDKIERGEVHEEADAPPDGDGLRDASADVDTA